MKIFTIAASRSEIDGGPGGGSYTVQSIERLGAYGEGGFPPCFIARANAERWLKEQKESKGFYLPDAKVCELELYL